MLARRAPENLAGSSRRGVLGACAALALITTAVFLPVLRGEFLNWDDDKYILHNNAIQNFDIAMVRWASTSTYMYNWHPVTWLSHALDFAIWGENPWGHHLTSLALHTLNTFLVAYVFWRGTGRLAASAFVGALFGLHPMHVESVAWIAERKDVLSTFFWLLTMLAYFAFTRKGGGIRYALVAGLLTLGLLSKAMVVTLPCVLLLLDIWPLNRFSRRAVLEKIPLLALSAAASAAAVFGQRVGGAVATFELVPFFARLQNAIYSYGRYLARMVWPNDLVALYPYQSGAIGSPGAVPTVLIFLISVTIAVFVLRKRHPYLMPGWFWYLGTLVPVIGLIQVGQQSMADRYTYVPFIGVFVMLSFGLDSLARTARVRRVCVVVATLVIALLGWGAVRQIPVWRDSEALWTHNLSIYPDHPFLHMKLAQALTAVGKTTEAAEHYRRTVAAAPNAVDALINLGNAHYRKREFAKSDQYYRQAIASDPSQSKAYALLGASLIQQNRLADGREQCRRALELNPREVVALDSLGIAFAMQNNLAAAIEQWEGSLEVDENSANAHRLLAKAYDRLGRENEALHHLQRIAEINGE